MKTSTRLLLAVLVMVNPVHSALGGDLNVVFKDEDGNLLEDAVIEILNPSVPVPDDWAYEGSMDQVDKEFVNNVIAVVEGSKVMFPNSDDLHHHVYSFSDNNTFELPLYIGDSTDPIAFNVAGVTVVGCNIHDWMLGYIYVAKTHLLAKTKSDGVASLQNLAAGEYTFSVWHPRIRRRDSNASYTVTVNSEGLTEYSVELDLGRDRRIRRAPSAGGKDY